MNKSKIISTIGTVLTVGTCIIKIVQQQMTDDKLKALIAEEVKRQILHK